MPGQHLSGAVLVCFCKGEGKALKKREFYQERASYARAGRVGATSHDSGKAPDTRGSHNAAALARYAPNCTPWAWPAGLAICPI